MFAQIDVSRRRTTATLDPLRRADLGQFFTPYEVAKFMASRFTLRKGSSITLLDAGAGVGSLSAAFMEQCEEANVSQLDIVAYELDPAVSTVLKKNLTTLVEGMSDCVVSSRLIEGDFIKESILAYASSMYQTFDYAILNPPYKKISSHSGHRLLLRKVGIETVNLYTAFVALSLLLLKKQGELVAVIPRSFCNGPYFKAFRYFLLDRAAIIQIHIFSSRDKAFKEDSVLQENIILHLIKGGNQGDVTISTSSGDSFSDYAAFSIPFERIVVADDPEKFIHIPSTEKDLHNKAFEQFSYSLKELGIEVSTGPVVDFRVKDFLRRDPTEDTIPLLYPGHFSDKYIVWPKDNFKKYNSIIFNDITQKQFFPLGCYTLVKRFSSKEEKKRIVARIVRPEDVSSGHIAFENHLNVFHFEKKGLPPMLALGLGVYLNSTLIDSYFRQFNGHTQVNATDLRLLKYPSKQVLTALGEWAQGLTGFDQEAIDEKIASLL